MDSYLHLPECIPGGTLFVDMGMSKLGTFSRNIFFTIYVLIPISVLAQYSFKLKSCFHDNFPLSILKLAMGIGLQFLCSYVTFPLYALVTQVSCFNPHSSIAFAFYIAKC